jgi:hypothetical protein
LYLDSEVAPKPPTILYRQPLWASVRRRTNINKPIRKLKKQKEEIVALIERYCKKKLVFARPLLPFGTVGEATAHCTHLQIAQAGAQTQICKRVQF